MAIHFVADIHLSMARPGRVEAFLGYLNGPARSAERLYILGDLFDLWLGDDDDTPPHPEVLSALARLCDGGPRVMVMHGNHDFAMDGGFETATGCRLIPDPSVAEVYGEPVLLMHGDTLCTDDLEYQAFRAHIRDPERLEGLLALPLSERRSFATAIRSQSREAARGKPPAIMDATQAAVEQALRDHGSRTLIHGHTHLPATHNFTLDGADATRIVLSDWYQRDGVLVWDEHGHHAHAVAELATKQKN